MFSKLNIFGGSKEEKRERVGIVSRLDQIEEEKESLRRKALRDEISAGEFEERMDRLDESMRAVESLQSTRSKLKSEIEELKSKKESLEPSCNRLKKERSRWKEKLDELKDERSELGSEVEEAVSGDEALTVEIMGEEEPESEIQDLLGGKVEDIKEKVEEMDLGYQEVLEVERENRNRKSLVDWLESKIEGVEEEVETEIDYEILASENVAVIKDKSEELDLDYEKLLEVEKKNQNRESLKEWLEEKIEGPKEVVFEEEEEEEEEEEVMMILGEGETEGKKSEEKSGKGAKDKIVDFLTSDFPGTGESK